MMTVWQRERCTWFTEFSDAAVFCFGLQREKPAVAPTAEAPSERQSLCTMNAAEVLPGLQACFSSHPSLLSLLAPFFLAGCLQLWQRLQPPSLRNGCWS